MKNNKMFPRPLPTPEISVMINTDHGYYRKKKNSAILSLIVKEYLILRFSRTITYLQNTTWNATCENQEVATKYFSMANSYL